MFEIVFLGTSASAPSVQRGLSAQVVKHNEHRFLIDCGEGTQRQILTSGLGFKKLNKILITHGHLDHILGLAGLFSTFSRWETIEEVEIMAGKWALERIHDLLYGVRVLVPGKMDIEVKMTEIKPGVIFQEGDFSVTAIPVSHRGPDCYGFVFEEQARRPFLPEKADALGVPPGPLRGRLVKGETITLENGVQVTPEDVLGEETPGVKFIHIGDTGKTKDLVDAVRGADALVIEATYLKEEEAMAHQFAHLTAGMAAELAAEAGVKHLLLTHVSRRYRERDIKKEARAVFENTLVARDFDVYQIRRGECMKMETTSDD
ncbi:MAG: ribonuclease Z [Anaerolineae bacterium]|nr:MAG: ribonuclease Z [Anaerolineae bacterium]